MVIRRQGGVVVTAWVLSQTGLGFEAGPLSVASWETSSKFFSLDEPCFPPLRESITPI